MPQVSGRADGSAVSQLVREKLALGLCARRGAWPPLSRSEPARRRPPAGPDCGSIRVPGLTVPLYR